MTGSHSGRANQITTGDDLEVARALLNEVDDLLFAVSVPEFRLTWANATALAYFKEMRSAPDPIGKSPRELAYDASRAEIFERLFSAAIVQGSVEADYRTPVDQRLWRLRVQPVTKPGHCIGVVVNGKTSPKKRQQPGVPRRAKACTDLCSGAWAWVRSFKLRMAESSQ